MAPKNAPGRKRKEDTLPAGDVKKLMSALRYREQDPSVADLRRCYQEGTNAEKREMIQKYLEDKSLKWRFEVIDKTEFKKTDTDRSKYEWKTAAAIAAKEGLDKQQEDDKKVLDVILRQYESRPHENAELAAMDVKQYKVLKEQKILDHATHQTTSCERAVTGKFAEKPSGSSSLPSGLKRTANTAEIVVNWGPAFKKLKSVCSKNLKKVEKLTSQANKHRSSADEEKRGQLREGTRMLQQAADALEDSMAELTVTESDSKKSEEDHEKLKTINQQMAESLEAFQKLLFDCVPKLANAGKEAEKEEETTK